MALEEVAFQAGVRIADGCTMNTVTSERSEVKGSTQGSTAPKWQCSDGVSSHQTSALSLPLLSDASTFTKKGRADFPGLAERKSTHVPALIDVTGVVVWPFQHNTSMLSLFQSWTQIPYLAHDVHRTLPQVPDSKSESHRAAGKEAQSPSGAAFWQVSWGHHHRSHRLL